MHINDFLSRLNRVRQLSDEQYQASCPTAMHKHGDRSAGLRVKAADDGRILVYCHAGCHAEQITSAMGMTLTDLYPQPERRPGSAAARNPRYISAAVAVAVAHDSITASLAIDSVLQGRDFTSDDIKTMQAASGRLYRFAQRMEAIS
jgi:hypothetical protein